MGQNEYEYGYFVRRPNKYGFWHLMLDFILTILTGGFWLIWILIRFLRSNTR